MTAPRTEAIGGRDWLLLTALAACFCVAFSFNHVALADLPPLTIVLGRAGLGALALHLLLRLRGERLPAGWPAWRAFLVLGALANALPLTLVVVGQTRIGSGLAAALIGTTPLLTMLAAVLLTAHERLTPLRLSGMLLGLAGTLVVIGPDTRWLGAGRAALTGELAVLGAALAYALAAIYGRRVRGLPPLGTATGQLTAATIWLAPVVLLVDRPWRAPAPALPALGALAGLALISTALAYVLYFHLLGRVGPTNLSLVTFLVPVGGLLLGALLFGERIEPRHLSGTGVLLVGLAAVDGRLPAACARFAGRRRAAARQPA